jgi:hypothetical protein
MSKALSKYQVGTEPGSGPAGQDYPQDQTGYPLQYSPVDADNPQLVHMNVHQVSAMPALLTGLLARSATAAPLHRAPIAA